MASYGRAATGGVEQLEVVAELAEELPPLPWLPSLPADVASAIANDDTASLGDDMHLAARARRQRGRTHPATRNPDTATEVDAKTYLSGWSARYASIATDTS